VSDTPSPADRQITRAAGVVMVGFVLSNAISLVQRILVSRAFGTGAEIDAFYAALRLPDLLFNLVAGGALASAFVPLVTAYVARGDTSGAWRLASRLANLVALTLGAFSLIAWVAAPWIVARVLAPGFDAEQTRVAVELLRVMLLTPTVFGVSGLLMGTLNAHGHFLLPALAPPLYWIGWVVGVLAFAPKYGIHGLAWGVVLGAGLHLSVQLPAVLRRGARYTPGLGWRDADVRRVGGLMAPRLLGVAAVQVNFLVNTILASGQPEGSLTALNLAFGVMMMPQVVIAQAIAIAALPTFSAQAARGDVPALRASLTSALRSVFFLSLPASVGLIVLRRPLVALLFQRGAFVAHSTELVAWALLFYAAGLVGHALVEILSRAFYALQDTRTPVVVGVSAMGLNVALSLTLAASFRSAGLPPHGGLALANSVATGLECVVLVLLIRRRVGGLELRRARRGLIATLLASALMGAVLVAWLAYTAPLSVAVVAGAGVVLGLAVYWLAALTLGSPEARELPRAVLPSRGARG
jgi:putative peptidoglycan lipid II flippase